MKRTHKSLSCHLILAVLHLSFLNPVTSATTNGSSHVSSGKILLDCGSSESSLFNGNKWTGDVGSKFIPFADKKSSTSVALNPVPSVPKIPYVTARIIHSQFTYSFPASPGLKFIRLYFYPASYSGLNPSKAYFSVVSGRYTLLNNFSPSVTADFLKSDYFTKEYSIRITENGLNITFTPSPMTSNSFAFVNGIEIFSIPIDLRIPSRTMPLPFVGQQAPFFVYDETATEMLYRVNVGTGTATITNIFGNWLDDLNYASSSQPGIVITRTGSYSFNASNTRYYKNDYDYAAPLELYTTARTMGSNDAINLNYNLTWAFPVDSGFRYLVRLHFCEISLEVTQVNQRVFKVYINNQTAENSMDLVALAGKPLVMSYRDYIVMVPRGNGVIQHLSLALHPNVESKPKFADAILNGIEIIKLSDSNNNLAVDSELKNEQAEKKTPLGIILGGTLGGIAGLIILSLIVLHGSWKKRVKWVSPWISQSNSADLRNTIVPLANSSDQYRQFTIAAVRAATNNFSEALVIGAGGFGKVYKGFIDSGVTEVAIKRGNTKSCQGFREFQNEIVLLSTFCHMNLVSLLGYCQEEDELILVYEYMARGTLRDHLYKTQESPLPWNQRLRICIGAARGLHYLHTGTKHLIIHRDIKSANILLDPSWVAKVSDFGLSKVGPITASGVHVSTEVKGTFGYLDPEYYKRKKLTEKSDVYSFGVVLFEVLCARPAVKPMVVEEEDEKVSLAEWALHCQQSGTIDRMIDPYLRGKIAPECLIAYVEIGVKCLAERGIERPTMGDVLGNLEQALTLQESVDAREANGDGSLCEIAAD